VPIVQAKDIMRFRIFAGIWLFLIVLPAPRTCAQGHSSCVQRAAVSHYDGADWHLAGEGVIGCPCRIPCPCRHNGQPSFGHCEATLYLHIREGHYGTVELNGLQAVEVGGACAMTYKKLAALYLDAALTEEQQTAFLKLEASFFSDGTAEFPYVRTIPINGRITDRHLFEVSIDDLLEMKIDRNWGRPDPPFPEVAACDHYANAIQYAQNIRYRMHDSQAPLEFDYSRRQANYRKVNVDFEQYRTKSMLIQLQDGSGWFNQAQLKLIEEQHLTLPDLKALHRKASRLVLPGGSDE